jgi:hypothetical protein
MRGFHPLTVVFTFYHLLLEADVRHQPYQSHSDVYLVQHRHSSQISQQKGVYCIFVSLQSSRDDVERNHNRHEDDNDDGKDAAESRPDKLVILFSLLQYHYTYF